MRQKSLFKKLRPRIFLVLIFISVIFLFFCSTVTAQTRKALLVGINKYEPEKPVKTPCRGEGIDLYGSINNVEVMKGLLVSRFGFFPEHVHVLTNKTATRQNILLSIEKYLVKDTSPGDVCVFYYSGHGSQVKNSESTEPDKKDETLVPFDWYRVNQDIRDKELKKLYNRVLDKKAHLTVIVDACHSGSISRGIPVRLRSLAMPENTCPVAEPSGKEKEPGERGALILSAAMDFQLAVQRPYNNDMYGAFTWALLKVLRSAPNCEPAQNVLFKVRALIQSEGLFQEPNLEGLPKLIKGPLFGPAPAKDPGIMVAVIKVDGKEIIFQGGIAAGIRKGCELQKVVEMGKESTVKVRVTEMYGLNRCQAEVISGDAASIKIGDFFNIHRWVVSPASRMRVWIPNGILTHRDLLNMCRGIEPLRNSNHIIWVDDPTEVTPTHIMSWGGSHWCLQARNGKTTKLGKGLSAETILRTIMLAHTAGKEKPRFFLHLPPSVETQKIMEPEIKFYSDSIEKLPTDEDAHYVLVGRYVGDEISYAWVLPNVTWEEGKRFALPIRTKWLELWKEGKANRKAVIILFDTLRRLVKVRSWMQLSSPPDKGTFPYHLALKSAKTGKVRTEGPLLEGDTYALVLRSHKDQMDQKVYARYVYVFSIDSEGKGTLLFPPFHRGNSENYFPVGGKFKKEIQLWDRALFKIGKPFGMDTYFLLTTEEPITHPEVLDFEGVRGELPPGEGYTPLERLLYGLGSGYRGGISATYINWSIQRLPILCKPRNE
jgi:hypothetical protein